MHRLTLSMAATFILGTGLTACATTESQIAAPRVSLSEVEMKRMSLKGQTFLLTFDVTNPNPFALPVQSVRYHLRLGEHRFASGESRSHFSVPARSDSRFAIEVDLNILRETASIASLLRTSASETVDYDLQGSLVVDVPDSKPLPFSASGVIPVKGGL